MALPIAKQTREDAERLAPDTDYGMSDFIRLYSYGFSLLFNQISQAAQVPFQIMQTFGDSMQTATAPPFPMDVVFPEYRSLETCMRGVASIQSLPVKEGEYYDPEGEMRTLLSEAVERLIVLVDGIEGFIDNHPNRVAEILLPELARDANRALDTAIDARDALITHEVACEPKSSQREFTNAGDFVAYLESLA